MTPSIGEVELEPSGHQGPSSQRHEVAVLAFSVVMVVASLDSPGTVWVQISWAAMWLSCLRQDAIRGMSARQARIAATVGCGWTACWLMMCLVRHHPSEPLLLHSGWPAEVIIGRLPGDRAAIAGDSSVYGRASGYTIIDVPGCAANLGIWTSVSLGVAWLLPENHVRLTLRPARFVAPAALAGAWISGAFLRNYV